jgi:hypothetical protein
VVNVKQMCKMLGGISIKTGYRILKENKINHFKIRRTYKIPKINILIYLKVIYVGTQIHFSIFVGN